MKTATLLAAAVALLAPGAALAQSQPPAQDGPICTDRPGKGTATCTAPAGHWQVEIDAVDLTHDRTAGVTTDTALYASANIKYGLTDKLDLELNLTPWQTSRVSGGGQAQSAGGFGDLVARVKFALPVPGDTVTAALDPYLKAPTAPLSLGNGAYEGGIVAPVSITLPQGFSLGVSPELDALENADGEGHHLAFAGALGLGHALTPTVTGGVELWGAVNQDPAGEVREASFDLSLAWIPARMQALQLDGGVNLGLNRATPGVQGYVGISRRF